MKKWAKKSIPYALAASMAFSVLPGAAAADKPGNGNGKGKGPWKVEQKVNIIVKNKWKLKDVESHWAREDIYKMSSLGLIKGYENLTYQPNKPVTQAEAISLLVRILEEYDGDIKLDSKSTVNLNDVPEWARTSIASAIAAGLVEDNKKFQANKPASRLFVTNLLVKLTGTNIDKEWLDADPLFKDVDSLSDREKAALAFATLTKLVSGYSDKTFQPNKPVTRAEMAVFLNRLLDLKEDLGEQIAQTGKGTIQSINKEEEELTIKQKVYANGSYRTVEKTYEIDDDAAIYINGKSASLSGLAANMSVTFTLDDDDEIIYLTAKSQVEKEETYKYTGDITKIDGNIVWVEVGLVSVPLNVTSNVKIITSNGQLGELKDLEVDQEISFNLNDNGDVTVISFDEKKSEDDVKELIASLDDLEKLDMTITGDDEFEANFYYDKKSDNDLFVASVKLEGETEYYEVGKTALQYMVDLFGKHQINFDEDDVELNELKQDLINEYDIEDANFEGNVIVKGTTYDIDSEDIVDEVVNELLDGLGKLEKLDFVINGDDDAKVDIYFERKSNGSYEATVELVNETNTFKFEGENALRFLVELIESENINFTTDSESEVIELIDDIIEKYDIEDPETDGIVVIDDTSFDLNEIL
ncbi:S-layer homology domain-containing protein [Bacillus sp. Marseille-P3661]|uniref:S-layer homology domain-containing protein n=1 Tax=Bacillus sp. Marseille-P3661 TaxID=1936234 RepID=UPI000C85BAA1|nr:S-layer homology domain-containing protein [Bacillus sp. Marseille-P3661]